ncbi:hypothetical protein [Epilithonimonas hominis]|uniref:hypothetical protein n=1 Tax=Epilithonimonas hominis TaxID=420404 RepID=UPI00289C896F|nr:hypothetical protein [Epilithonimonas hominis]
MPIPTDGSSPTSGYVSPSSQSVSWNRQDIYPIINNVNVTSTNAEFVEYYIQFENSSINWLEIQGYDENSGYLNNFNGGETLKFNLKNLDQLSGSNYKATIYLTFIKSEGANLQKSTVVNLSITGSSADQIRTDKTNYTVIYRRNQNQLSGDTHVNILNNNSGSNLGLETIGTLFKELNFTSGFDLVEDPAFPFSTNSELPSTGVTVVPCRIKKEGQSIYSFTATIVVIDSEDIVVSPGNFDFLLRKGFNESKQGTLMITNPLNKNFSITAPWWINLSINAGSSSVDLGFSTVNSEGIDPGNYSGVIRISYDSKIIDIPVSLQVKQFAGIESENYNFCLDGVILWANRLFDNGIFARINLKMQFTTDEGTSEFLSSYLIPFFNGEAKTDLGQKVQNYFPIYSKHLFSNVGDFNNKLVYKPAKVFVTIEELDVNYNILHSTVLNSVSFFAGKKPIYFPFLTNNGFRRTYADFFHIFSFYTGAVIPDHFISNQNANPISDDDVQTVLVKNKSILNSDFLKSQGLEFVPFPKVEKQISLQWLNNNLVPESMIFSGTYIIQDDFEHSYDNFQINGKKYSTKEVSKITIKTGFILKQEVLLLIEIANSLMSFLKIDDKIYNCICITPKLVREDSDENLIQREMEFFIVL